LLQSEPGPKLKPGQLLNELKNYMRPGPGGMAIGREQQAASVKQQAAP